MGHITHVAHGLGAGVDCVTMRCRPPTDEPRTRVFLLVVVMVAAAVLFAMSPAGAQDSIEVPLGDTFTIENGSQCRSNAEVLVTLIDADGRDRSVGSAIADRNGHFLIEALLPATAALGPAVLSVDCGIPDSLLVYRVQLVESTPVNFVSYAAYVLVAAAVGLLILLAVRVRRQARETAPAHAADLPAVPPTRTAPAPLPVQPEVAPAEPPSDAASDDDDAEYWIWDNETQAGPVKRLACLSRTTLYLHEVALADLSELLDQLASVGPEIALATAFVVVPIADVAQVRHHGTHLRITYRSGGETLSRTIDLGTEVEGVVDLLSQRVPVLADAAIPVS